MYLKVFPNPLQIYRAHANNIQTTSALLASTLIHLSTAIPSLNVRAPVPKTEVTFNQYGFFECTTNPPLFGSSTTIITFGSNPTIQKNGVLGQCRNIGQPAQTLTASPSYIFTVTGRVAGCVLRVFRARDCSTLFGSVTLDLVSGNGVCVELAGYESGQLFCST
ncbi:hypothetical protein LTR27_010726 [Elasticomyces elasticus]|nr:hypothetical protein LTR27_010726 [Elasticomyces elasticus]